MKMTILSLLCLLAFTAVFAGDPIPGVGVKSGKNPGGQNVVNTKTDNDGRFALTVKEVGRYDITVSYNEIQTVLKRMGKSGGKITLALDGGKIVEVINEQSDVITVDMPTGGGVIKGRLSYSGFVIKENGIK